MYNRSGDKTDNAVARAQKEGLGDNLVGFKDMGEFVQSLAKPRCVIILVKAGAPVDATIEGLAQHMEPGDIIAVTVEEQGGSPDGTPTTDPITAIPTNPGDA